MGSSVPPNNVKLYHIVHYDRLPSIIQEGFLYSDAEIQKKKISGTTLGMHKIKNRRLSLLLRSYPGLYVGKCVPFYFCPRSVMLYLFYKNNHTDINYSGGQQPIIHLVADLEKVTHWAEQKNKRWVFTNSNAGSCYFNDYNDLGQLDEIDWEAVQAKDWQEQQEKKQAEFLLEHSLSFRLIESIGVYSDNEEHKVKEFLSVSEHKPLVSIRTNWYY